MAQGGVAERCTESINFKFFHFHALAGDSWTALGEKFTEKASGRESESQTLVF
jgi:hypothetical protein